MNSEGTVFLMRAIKAILYTLACLAVLASAIGAVIVIQRTQPVAEQTDARRTSAAPVETIEVERGEYRPEIVVLGTVQPAQSVVLGPRVAGQVVEVSSDFAPGGMVSQGQVLVRIDPSDYENALAISQGQLEQAQAALEIEQARRHLATRELDLLGESVSESDRDLVLRKPQLDSIRAQVNAAEAAVQQSKLDLDRTNVLAPFNAQVIRRSTDIGAQVASGDDLGQLVGTAEYWIMAAVPLQTIPWLEFTAGDRPGSPVDLGADFEQDGESARQAQVARMIGALDQQTRLVRVLITVPDPLGLVNNLPPLILDSLIEVTIRGKQISDVVRIDRRLIREGNRVWVCKGNVLQLRQVQIVFRDSRYAYLRSGLNNGDRVVSTNLATVTPGLALRDISHDSAQAADAEPSATSGSEGANP